MKKVLLVVLTVVFTLSLATMAFAANTSTSATTADKDTNYGNYPLGYGIGGTDLKSGLAATDGTFDNGLGNANKTGEFVGGQGENRSVIKAVDKQRTHGEYQNNTNSCASCHQVHTGAGENLLFKDGVYQTCTACHDGTLGVLNVFAGSTAGTFGGTAAGHATMHLPTGVMETKAAPGGNHSGEEVGGTWTEQFNCASCHSPHGSYSDRLLNYNPNGIGESDMYFRATDGSFTNEEGASLTSTDPLVKTGGLKLVGAKVLTSLPAAYATNDSTSPEYVVYQTVDTNTTDFDDPNTDFSKTGIKEDIPGATGANVIVVMKKVKVPNTDPVQYKYARDLTPWIGNVYNFRGTTKLMEMTNFYTAYNYASGDSNKANNVKFSANPTASTLGTSPNPDKIIVKWSYGYIMDGPATGDGVLSVKYADISRATVVKFDFYSTKDTFNNIPVKEVDIASYSKAGYAMPINGFCAACHTDYFNNSGSETGTWSKAFRHNTKGDSYTCLKCHFAHGTDVNVMLDAKDQSLATLTAAGGQFVGDTDGAKAYLLDKNPSSALKRYTNMSVCWKCHTSSHSEDLTNNQWVQGGVSSGFGSSEFTKNGTNLPQGWVDADQSKLPYAGNQTIPTWNK